MKLHRSVFGGGISGSYYNTGRNYFPLLKENQFRNLLMQYTDYNIDKILTRVTIQKDCFGDFRDARCDAWIRGFINHF